MDEFPKEYWVDHEEDYGMGPKWVRMHEFEYQEDAEDYVTKFLAIAPADRFRILEVSKRRIA